MLLSALSFHKVFVMIADYYIQCVFSFPAISKEELSRVCGILQHHAYKWKVIGQGLGFTNGELSNIEAKPTLITNAPCSYLDAMLSDWWQWVPGDCRGSTDYATLASLKSAVSSAGLGRTAREEL